MNPNELAIIGSPDNVYASATLDCKIRSRRNFMQFSSYYYESGCTNKLVEKRISCINAAYPYGEHTNYYRRAVFPLHGKKSE